MLIKLCLHATRYCDHLVDRLWISAGLKTAMRRFLQRFSVLDRGWAACYKKCQPATPAEFIMAEITRFGTSIDARLLERFDALIAEKGYDNRSEAIRDLIRNALVEEQWADGNQDTVATVTLVYDHHTRDLSDKLTEHQHAHHQAIISVLHVHLDAHHCLEVVVLRGRAQDVRRLADELIGTKGVKHGKLVTSATGANLP
jgi:CopG family transcriptional regulator, nickel-responsive regulator